MTDRATLLRFARGYVKASKITDENSKMHELMCIALAALETWDTLTDEQRLMSLEQHPCCRHCGSLDTGCRCWDDS